VTSVPPVTLTVRDKVTTTLTAVLKITSSSGIAPATAVLTLIRSARKSNFWAILGISGLPGVILIAVFLIFRKKPISAQAGKPSMPKDVSLHQRLGGQYQRHSDGGYYRVHHQWHFSPN
jgi:hypothetical protein